MTNELERRGTICTFVIAPRPRPFLDVAFESLQSVGILPAGGEQTGINAKG